jgi:ATP-dependent DNA helicase RecG
MNKKELAFILKQGEGTYVEFKESLDPKSVAREIVAFANTQGGRIFLGITDLGIVKGTKITNELKAQIQDVAHNCDPSIKVHLDKYENILIINVTEGEDKPYICSQGFFVRVGAQSQKLSRDEIFDFAVSEGKIRWDEQINKEFNFEKDFDESKLDQYLKLAGLTKNIPVKEILINLRVAKYIENKFKFNNAGVLFFAKQPGKFYFSSKVVCAVFRNNEKVDILDRKIFDNGIIANISQAQSYVDIHNDTEFIIKELARKEIPQFPKDAYREAIVNAVMHRDYMTIPGDIMVEIYKNKVLVSNPGGLVRWMKKNEFGKKSCPRNSLIAELLSKTDYVEKMGTGINRIKIAMSTAGLLAPEFDYNEYWFATTLLDKTGGKGIQPETSQKPAKTQPETSQKPVKETRKKLILEAIVNKSFTNRAFSAKIGVNRSTIESDLIELKAENKIRFVGSKKGGHWEIIK